MSNLSIVRVITLIGIALSISWQGFLSTAAAQSGVDQLVLVCFRGRTVTVPTRLLSRYFAAGATLGSCQNCGSRLGVIFDQETYTIAPGEPFVAEVLICRPPSAGLFSFGVEVTLEGGNFSGTGFASMVPSALNFHTVREAGADVSSGPQPGVAKGSVDFFREPLAPYFGTTLAFIQIPGLPAGTYTLRVKPRNDLGPTEQIFVDGNGQVLDGALAFGSSQVIVGSGVQGPGTSAPLALSLQALAPDALGRTGLRFITEPGRQYFVQYSRDLSKWTTILPPFTGDGAPVQWTDSGPPETDPKPSEVDTRFYRLLRLDP